MNKNVSIILIIGVLVIGAFIGAFYFLNRADTPAIIPALDEDEEPEELSDWKIYSNEEYGFEFQYPTYAEISFEENPIYLDHPEAGAEIVPGARYLNPVWGPIAVPSAVLDFKFINPTTGEEAIGVNLGLRIFSLKQHKQPSYHFGNIAYDAINKHWYISEEGLRSVEVGIPITEELITEQGTSVYKILVYSDVGYVTDSYVLINTERETVFEFSKTTGANEYDLSPKDNQKFVDRILEDLSRTFSNFWLAQ